MTEFETKDSGERIEYVSGMSRDTQNGKPRFDLLVTDDLPFEDQFLTRFAALLARGAEKYGERNWQLADSPEELARFKASGSRHFMQWMCGEVDEDHAAAVAFNIMAAEYVKWKLDDNLRPGKIITAADMNTGVRYSVVEKEGYWTCKWWGSSCRNPSECLGREWVPQERNSTPERDV